MGLSDARVTVRTYLPLIMGVLVVGLYASSMDNPFMQDDYPVIVDNPVVNGDGGSKWIWIQELWMISRAGVLLDQPVALATYVANSRMTGVTPQAFRLVNILILAFLGGLTAVWLWQYAGHPGPAWLAAFLFVAHPVHAELINHIVGRAHLLAMTGVVAFLLLQKLALQSAPFARRDGHQHRIGGLVGLTGLKSLAALAAAGLAFGSADTGRILIPLVIVQAWCAYGRKSKPRPTSRWVIHLITLLCLAVPALCYLWVRGVVVDMLTMHKQLHQSLAVHDLTLNPLVHLAWSERIPATLAILGDFAQSVVWPNTAFIRHPIDPVTWADPLAIIGAAVLVASVLSLFLSGIRRHWLVLAPTLVLAQYLIVCNVLIVSTAYPTNLQVLPITLAATVMVAWLIDRVTHPSTRKRAVAVIPCAVLIGLMAQGVLVVNQRWFSAPRLMAWELNNRPSDAVAMYRYGHALVQAGVYPRARYWLEVAMAIEPSSIQVRQKLALARLMQGDTPSAEDQYERILDRSPDDLEAHVRLAGTSLARHDLEQAELHISAATRVNPLNVEVMYLAARLAAEKDNPVEARLRYRAMLNRYPTHQSARQELAALDALLH